MRDLRIYGKNRLLGLFRAWLKKQREVNGKGLHSRKREAKRQGAGQRFTLLLVCDGPRNPYGGFGQET
jgi:hypothetical protein